MTKQIVVIGGGIVGRCSALALASDGWRVTIVDDDPHAQAPSWGNAGPIATEQVAPLASWPMIRSAPRRLFRRGGALALPPRQIAHWLPFAARLVRASTPARFDHGRRALGALMAQALPAWARLVAAIGAPDLLRETGHLVAWPDAASARAGREGWSTADTGIARFRDADPDDRASLHALSGATDAIRFEHSGQIADLGRLLATLHTALLAAGVSVVPGRARLAVDGARAIVAVDRAVLPADHVLVAAGIGAKALLGAAGHRVPIVAERGYHLRSTDHDWPADLPPVVFEDRSIIVTRYEHCVQIASFVEPGDPEAPPDPAKWKRLESHIAALGLPIRGPFTRWMGARPTLPDYLPAIGTSRRCDTLSYAFGHQHLGLTLAPVTAEIVAGMLAGRPTIPRAPFDIDRFDKGYRP